MIDISPNTLEYKPPFTTQSTEYVTITNNSAETVAFKVKTTAPKFYCVRPNASVVAPGEQVQVQVILLGLAEEPTSDFKCRDKFLVITLPAPYDLGSTTVAEAWPQLEAEFKQQAVSKKIKVKYLLDAEPRAAEVEEEPTDVIAAVAAEAPKTQESIPEVKEVVEEPEEVVKPKLAPASTIETPSSTQKLAEKQEGSVNPIIILFVALIALILGWLYY